MSATMVGPGAEMFVLLKCIADDGWHPDPDPDGRQATIYGYIIAMALEVCLIAMAREVHNTAAV